MNDIFEQKKVSVIIPTYNRAKFLPDAVKSILDQKYENIEIIIVDDGSDDNTFEVVTKLKGHGPIIKYYKNERAKGPSGARNTGILKSTGDFLAFLDSDDVWLEGHLSKGSEILNRYPGIGVLFGNHNIVNFKNGKHFQNFFEQKCILHTLRSDILGAGIRLLKDNLFEALIQENFFLLGSVLVRKSVADGILFDEAIMFSEDRDFGIQLYKRAKAAFAYREDPVYISYKHESNIYKNVNSIDVMPVYEAHLHLFEKYFGEFSLSSRERRILAKLIAKKLSVLSYMRGKNKEYREAVLLTIKSFNYAATFTQVKNTMKLLLTFLPVTTRHNS